jgi:hypothetical protein
MPDLSIRLLIDRSQAQRAAREQAAADRDLRDAVRATGTAQERAATEAARARIRGADQAGRAERESFGNSTTMVRQFGDTIKSVAVSALSIGALTGVAQAIAGAFKSANEQAQAQLDKLLATKDALRELAAVKGVAEGPSDAFAMAHFQLRKASGLSEQEAAGFALEFAGAGAALRGKNISAGEYERAEPLLARFAATQGGGASAAESYGKLAGLLLGTRETFATAEDLLAEQMSVVRMYGTGTGKNPVLMAQGAAAMGSLVEQQGTGAFGGALPLAAMVATASRVNPETAATQIQQGHRLLRGFSEKWAPMLGEAGITEADKEPEAYVKLFNLMERAQRGGKAPDLFLSEAGVSAEVATTVQGLYNQRAFMAERMREAQTPMGVGAATAQLDRAFMQDPTLRIKQAQAKEDAAERERAMQLQADRELTIAARAGLTARAETGTAASQLEDWKTGMLMGVTPPMVKNCTLRAAGDGFRG